MKISRTYLIRASIQSTNDQVNPRVPRAGLTSQENAACGTRRVEPLVRQGKPTGGARTTRHGSECYHGTSGLGIVLCARPVTARAREENRELSVAQQKRRWRALRNRFVRQLFAVRN